ncbi:MAG: hypothetical protein LBR11_02185 [Deltaproteobacteria bacterium]|jgi:tetratricopeptide (TPR) repeat protein|nr:hypothetical protein [Deltaproteobacteria bacterium]
MTALGKNRLNSNGLRLGRVLEETREIFEAVSKTFESDQLDRLLAQGAVKLLRARDLYEAMAQDYDGELATRVRLAQAAADLVEVYLLANQWPEALALSRQLRSYGRSAQVSLYRAQTGARLVAYLTGANRFLEAEKIFRGLRALGRSEPVVAEVAKACFYLLTALIQTENSYQAREFYDELMELAAPFLARGRTKLTLVPPQGSGSPLAGLSGGEFRHERPRLSLVKVGQRFKSPDQEDCQESVINSVAKASVNIITCYILDRETELAVEAYERFAALELVECQNYLNRSTSDMVFAHARAGNWAKARHFYELLVASVGDDSQDFRARAASNLAILLGESQRWLEAEEMIEELASLGPPEKAQDDKSRAVTSMLLGYLDQKLWGQALAFYRGLGHEGGVGFSLATQAEAATTLLNGLAQGGQVDLARIIFDNFSRFNDLPGYPDELAAAALGLVDGYCREKRFDEAQAIHQLLLGFAGSEEIPVAQARSHFVLATALALAGRLDEAMAVFGGLASLTPTPKVEEEKSKTMVNLISCLGSAGRLREAMELFESFARLQASAVVIENKALAAYNMLCDYARRRRIDQALELLAVLSQLGQNSMIGLLRAEAAVELIQGAVKAGRWRVAEKVFESMTDGPGSVEFLAERVRAAIILINEVTRSWPGGDQSQADDMSDREKLDLARYAFVTLDGLALGSELGDWARALVNLVSALESVGLTMDAQKAHESIALLGPSPEILGEWAKASFNRITMRIEAGRLEEALALLEELRGQGQLDPVRPCLAKAMVNVVSALGQAGWLTEAQNICEQAKALGPGGQMLVYQAKMLYNLILGYLKAGCLLEAAQLFGRFEPAPELREVCPHLVEAALELIIGLAEAGQLREARRIHQTMAKILTEVGFPGDWASFETIVKDPPSSWTEKSTVIAVERLRETVQDLQERRGSREYRELADLGHPSRRPDGDGRSNLRPWTFGHFRRGRS